MSTWLTVARTVIPALAFLQLLCVDTMSCSITRCAWQQAINRYYMISSTSSQSVLPVTRTSQLEAGGTAVDGTSAGGTAAGGTAADVSAANRGHHLRWSWLTWTCSHIISFTDANALHGSVVKRY